jgi:hypothetical protein
LALFFAANAHLDRHFAPIAVLLAVLEAAAVWVALQAARRAVLAWPRRSARRPR